MPTSVAHRRDPRWAELALRLPHLRRPSTPDLTGLPPGGHRGDCNQILIKARSRVITTEEETCWSDPAMRKRLATTLERRRCPRRPRGRSLRCFGARLARQCKQAAVRFRPDPPDMVVSMIPTALSGRLESNFECGSCFNRSAAADSMSSWRRWAGDRFRVSADVRSPCS